MGSTSALPYTRILLQSGDSYESRMVNLTTFTPDIVAAILDESHPPEVTLFELAAGAPVLCGRSSG